MKIEIGINREFILKDVFSSVVFVTADGEELSVCMRDSGFEICYSGIWYEAKNGFVPSALSSQNRQIENGGLF